MGDYKFCPCCGSAMISKDGESGWTKIALCTDCSCRTMICTTSGDMGESDTTSIDLLTLDDYNKLYAKIKDPRIKRLNDTSTSSLFI